jgi:hypothetical protein
LGLLERSDGLFVRGERASAEQAADRHEFGDPAPARQNETSSAARL